MCKILQARLQQYVNRELPDVRAGFRKGRGTKDQTASIHWIIEKTREFQINIYFCFIHFGPSCSQRVFPPRTGKISTKGDSATGRLVATCLGLRSRTQKMGQLCSLGGAGLRADDTLLGAYRIPAIVQDQPRWLWTFAWSPSTLVPSNTHSFFFSQVPVLHCGGWSKQL